MIAIAIDGPAGAGKSTVARAVADRLGFTYVDTGAMYRAVALCTLERGVDPGDERGAAEVAGAIDIAIAGGRVRVDGRDISGSIRQPDVTRASADVARHPAVRDALVAIQRRMASEGDVVMEGRDIGTQVLPDAPVKVFLTASLDERAVRRGRETGVGDDGLEALRAAISERDSSDMSRDASPLVQAADAVVVDSTGKSIADVVDEIVRLVEAAR